MKIHTTKSARRLSDSGSARVRSTRARDPPGSQMLWAVDQKPQPDV